MKKLIFCFLLFFKNIILFSQNDSISFDKNAISKNVVYGEFWGNGNNGITIPFTFNYERAISTFPKLMIGIRIGFFYWNEGKIRDTYSVPMLITLMTNPTKSKHIEFDFGVTTNNYVGPSHPEHDEVISYGLTTGIKFRYQRNKHGFFFTGGPTPTYYFPDKYYKWEEVLFLFTGGISLGYHF